MLVIRMQRTGRKGHAMFRVVVQDSRRTPTSGKVVATLGSYDPHSKAVNVNKEAAQKYLDNGAQPTDRVARLLKSEGVKLPKWVKLAEGKKGEVRNADKRRSTRPAKPEAEAEPEVPAEETLAEETTPAEPEAQEAEAPAEEAAAAPEAPAEETPAEAEAEK